MRTGIKNLLGMASEVGVGRLKHLACSVFPFVGISHDDDMVALSEWIPVVGDWLHDDLRVVSRGLITRRTIIIPLWKLINRFNFEVEGSTLGAKSDATAVNPDVFCNSHILNLSPSAGIADILVVKGKVLVVGHMLFDIDYILNKNLIIVYT